MQVRTRPVRPAAVQQASRFLLGADVEQQDCRSPVGGDMEDSLRVVRESAQGDASAGPRAEGRGRGCHVHDLGSGCVLAQATAVCNLRHVA